MNASRAVAQNEESSKQLTSDSTPVCPSLPINPPSISSSNGSRSAQSKSNGKSNYENIAYDDGSASTKDAFNAIKSMDTKSNIKRHFNQVDGKADGSSSEEDDDDDVIDNEIGDDEDDVDDKVTNEDCEGKEDPDPLNSEDDLSSVDSNKSNNDLFDTDHVIVCQ